MSQIDRLIQEFCREGVRFVPLGEALRNLDSKRRPITKGDRQGGIYPYYGANGIQDYVADYIFEGTFLLVGEDGSVKQPDGRPVLNWATGRIWVNNHAHVLQSNRDDLDLRFVYFYLQTVDISPLVTGGTQPKLNQQRMNSIPIAVPPLEVQREIVRILDQFTQLEAELEAELEARRQQYAYHRRVMLSRIDAETVTLAGLGKWQGGITPSKGDARYWTGGDIPWLASMDISDESTDEIRGRVTDLALQETSLKIVPAPSVAVVMRSNILRRRLPIGLVEVDTTVNQDMRALIPRDGVHAEYVYQVLRADSEKIRGRCVRTDGSMAAVNSQDFFAWEIPLPPLEEQRRITTELRLFDDLVNDLSIGLPAELAARRKQYGYYRDKLLTFKELAA